VAGEDRNADANDVFVRVKIASAGRRWPPRIATSANAWALSASSGPAPALYGEDRGNLYRGMESSAAQAAQARPAARISTSPTLGGAPADASSRVRNPIMINTP
jgi:hypothetical protein